MSLASKETHLSRDERCARGKSARAFARAYGDQIERDHEALRRAISTGRVPIAS